MNTEYGNGNGPKVAGVQEQIAATAVLDDDADVLVHAALADGAVAFVHFDPNAAKSHMVEALVHHEDLVRIHRGLYVRIRSTEDSREYVGRVVEGPFYNPDALKRDSTPIQFIILNQGKGKVLSVPEYHGWVQIELLGEDRDSNLLGVVRRPHPASPIFPYDGTMMAQMLRLRGNVRLGLLDNYPDVFVNVDGEDKGVMPRNWLTTGTIGSGKSNTDQVFIEETLDAGYAQVVIDPEGEYIFMDQASVMPGIEEALVKYGRRPTGVKSMTVYRPPLSESNRKDAIEFTVPFDSISPEIIQELTEMSSAQQQRFTFLYDQAVQLLLKQTRGSKPKDELDISKGFPGVTLDLLLSILDQEIAYYEWKRSQPKSSGKKKGAEDADDQDAQQDDSMRIYCHEYKIPPLMRDQYDASSYPSLAKHLRLLKRAGIFDKPGVQKLDMEKLSEPGHLSVIDMSDASDQLVTNIVIADLLARMYQYKMGLSESENNARKVFLTIEEAHGFVSRDRQDKMEQTLDQLRRIARRGRKRWLSLHFITQSPQHLPSELFELANNKIIHQTTGAENLRVLRSAAGTVNESIWNDVPSLGRGRAVLVSSQYPHPIIVQIRPAASRRNFVL